MDTLELSSPQNPAILYLGRALRAPGSKAHSLTTSVKMKLAFSRGKLIGSLTVTCPPCDRAWWVCLQKNRWEIMLDLYCVNLTISSHFLSFSVFTSCSGRWPWTCRSLIRSLVDALLLAIMFLNFKLFCSWTVPFLYNSNLLLSCGFNSLSNFPKEANFCFLSFWCGVLLLPFLVFLLHLVIFGCPFLFLDGRGG